MCFTALMSIQSSKFQRFLSKMMDLEKTWEDLCLWNQIFMALQMLCLLAQNLLMLGEMDNPSLARRRQRKKASLRCWKVGGRVHSKGKRFNQATANNDNSNKSINQASRQGIDSVSPRISHQVVCPTVIVPTPNEHEQVNQLRLQSSNQSGRKRKISSSSFAGVGKEKATSVNDNTNCQLSQGDDVMFNSSNSISTLRKIYATCARDEHKGPSLVGAGHLHPTKSELLSCHFDSHGKLLATAGNERKVVIWDLKKNVVNCVEVHAHQITDIRFRPNSTVFATSSFDRTVMIWDADEPMRHIQNLVGHAEHVMSIDFHPTKTNLLSSCDSADEIRLWDVNRGDCNLIFKGGNRQVRFQPRFGSLLASTTGNIINVFDVETNNIQHTLLGHVHDIHSICWDMSGMYMASVSEDSARIWCVTSGECIHELWSSSTKFQSCTFHPGHGQVLVIGCHEVIECWNPIFQSNRTWQQIAHDGVVSSLADSPETGIMASVSHDQFIKIWE